MEVNLRYAEERNSDDIHGKLFDILKATLQSPTNPPAKVAKLVEDIIFIYKTSEEKSPPGADSWYLWFVFFDIVSCIPPGHTWQETLIQTLKSLRQRDGSPYPRNPAVTWKDIPGMTAVLYEISESLPDIGAIGVEKLRLNPPPFALHETARLNAWFVAELEEDVIEQLERRKNLNSFVARVSSKDYFPWVMYPIWELRDALENSPVLSPQMECQIWVVTEWIIHCADQIFNFVCSGEKFDERDKRAFATGRLCDCEPDSLERWEFWKKRFSELAIDVGPYKLGSETTGCIYEALKIMDAVNVQNLG